MDVIHAPLAVPVHRPCGRKLEQLDSADDLRDLRNPPGNRLEILRGSRSDRYSIRINDQYRICFAWSDDGPKDVEIIDYH